ncbi:MAG: hypothetical protein GY799_21390 [Desulfobulbaceae bacterium]|nr:hypothetical protein [Desulfobulbaceae bacterium]
MSAVLTRPAKIGNVVKQEFWADSGWCRKTVTVTVTSGMEIGAVLEETSVGGKGTLVVTATAANASCILIDKDVYTTGTGDHSLVVLYKGPSIVAKNALTYGTITSGAETTAEAALTVLGMKVEDSTK